MYDYLDCFTSQEKAIETIHKVIKYYLQNDLDSLSDCQIVNIPPAERSSKVVDLDSNDIPIKRALGIT